MNISSIIKLVPEDVNTDTSRSSYMSLVDKESGSTVISRFAKIEFMNIQQVDQGAAKVKILVGSLAGQSKVLQSYDAAMGSIIEYAVSEFISPILKTSYMSGNDNHTQLSTEQEAIGEDTQD